MVTSFAATIDERFRVVLEEADAEVILAPGLGKTSSDEEVLAAVSGARAIIAGSEPYRRSTLEQLPELKAIVRAGAGIDGIDVSAATELGIHASSTPGANAESVADYTLALMLAAGRLILPNDRAVRDGQWRTPQQGIDLFRKTVGIVGYGAIGQAVARRLTGFECTLLAYDPVLPEGAAVHGVRVVPLDDLLAESRFLTVHVPLLPETTGLIGESELAQMPRGSVVVNAARGGIIDEAALRAAVESGQLLAAATDVFTSEPVRPSNPLLENDRILTTAHVAAFSADGADAMLRLAASELLPFL
ncbi:phosphoglycerate dehydrogenase [Gulosibacter chungangensis]|uniref:phosphoglycerate dehydrogenase n=1 Tax=Gulosibacter chungangensis TaxID=979746 RepID=UPI0017888AB2|nr:phosphoglycerate dehydrogenase [Gulosibacter chungangensis]